MGSNDGITKSLIWQEQEAGPKSIASEDYERESLLQEVKRAHLSSKNRISSSSWRLKEMQVLEERLWKWGSVKLDCLSVSAGATPQ